MQFKNELAEVHLIDLTDVTAGIPLCSEHARTRTAPVGWEMVDKRSPSQVDVWATTAPEPAAVPDSRPTLRREHDAQGFHLGHADQEASNSAQLNAASPLLSRAFRVVPHN